MTECKITVRGKSKKEILKGLMSVQKRILDDHKSIDNRSIKMEYKKATKE